MYLIITQILGMIFVGIIIVCIVWTFGSYVLSSNGDSKLKGNEKLLDNMNKLK